MVPTRVSSTRPVLLERDMVQCLMKEQVESMVNFGWRTVEEWVEVFGELRSKVEARMTCPACPGTRSGGWAKP
jgi:hypothetical protein